MSASLTFFQRMERILELTNECSPQMQGQCISACLIGWGPQALNISVINQPCDRLPLFLRHSCKVDAALGRELREAGQLLTLLHEQSLREQQSLFPEELEASAVANINS